MLFCLLRISASSRTNVSFWQPCRQAVSDRKCSCSIHLLDSRIVSVRVCTLENQQGAFGVGRQSGRLGASVVSFGGLHTACLNFGHEFHSARRKVNSTTHGCRELCVVHFSLFMPLWKTLP